MNVEFMLAGFGAAFSLHLGVVIVAYAFRLAVHLLRR